MLATVDLLEGVKSNDLLRSFTIFLPASLKRDVHLMVDLELHGFLLFARLVIFMWL